MNPTQEAVSPMTTVSEKQAAWKLSLAEIRRYTAEAVGTMFLGVVVLFMASQQGLGIYAPFVAGITLAVITYAFGVLSGAHVNPAVTLGALSINKINVRDAIGYIVAQFIGAFATLGLVVYFTDRPFSLTQTGNELTLAMFFAELLGAVILGIGIAAVMYGRVQEPMSGAVIGSAFLVGIFIALLTGSFGILNPAIAFGGNLLNVVTVLGPIVGVALGMNLYRFIKS